MRKTIISSMVILASLLSTGIASASDTEITIKNNNKNTRVMKFELPKLPYELDALAPVISKQTMELHYGKHLQTYITNLNNLIVGTEFENAELEEIVKKSSGPIFNNAGQALNHNIYFLTFSPKGGGEPKGKLADAIKAEWGSFENFKKEFSASAVGVFGAGWAWLSKDASGKLKISQHSNASTPLTDGRTPLLGFDVWEHSYYLDYQNRRADHIAEIWKIIDWSAVEARY